MAEEGGNSVSKENNEFDSDTPLMNEDNVEYIFFDDSEYDKDKGEEEIRSLIMG